MGQSFSLGRIAGIRIGVNWSVLLIVALLAYGLAAGQFPADVPRRPEAEYVVAAIVTAVAYIASLLAHELAHSLVARRNGIEVEGNCTVALFASVFQTTVGSRVILNTAWGRGQKIASGIAPEDAFLMNFANAIYWRVGGSLMWEEI